jgi:hypothetical protein
MASPAPATSIKHTTDDVSPVPAKKARTNKVDSRSADIEKIKALIPNVNDASLKAALEAVIGQSGTKKAIVSPKKMSDEEVKQAANSVIRRINSEIKSKMQWKPSFKGLKGGGVKGARVEVVCNSPEVFDEIFKNQMGATVKTSKDGKKTCSMKTDEEVKEIPFSSPDYRYSYSELKAPFTASLKDNALVFGFKFTIH